MHTWNNLSSPTPPLYLKTRTDNEGLIHNERWLTFPTDPTIVFPRQTFSPKVQMECEAGPKRIARNVETERRRRLYESFDLEVLLREKGINASDINKQHYIPLETFDDYTYDCRTAEEWLRLGEVASKRHPLPAQALTIGADKWQLVAVINYNEDSSLRLLSLDGKKTIFTLPRLRVRFIAEDPRIFAERLESALKTRRFCEARLEYNLYIDCMPLEGMSAHVNETINYPHTLHTNYPHSKGIITLASEVERNYSRVMCELECRETLKHLLGIFDDYSIERIQSTAHERKKVDKIKNKSSLSCSQAIRQFSEWNSLYVHSEVHEAMMSIALECEKASKSTLFSLRLTKSVSLEEFESQQLHASHSLVNYLRDGWLENICQAIRISLRDIGKGWFDLRQCHHDIYDAMKLNRFMQLVRQRMQSALRTLIETSAVGFLRTLEAPTMCMSNVDEKFVWKSNLKEPLFESNVNPIFTIELYMNDNGAHYTTDPNLYAEKFDALLVNALQLCQQINQLHPALLHNLTFSRDLYVKSVNIKESIITNVRNKLNTAYRKSIIPLVAYLENFDKYRDLFGLDPLQYVENYKEEEHTVIELKDEITMHFAVISCLESDIPQQINVGPFEVNIGRLKSQLIDKQQNVITGLLEMHAKRLRGRIDEMLDEFTMIFYKLNVVPATIEQVFEIREWMEGLPITVAEHIETLQTVRLEFDMLDVFYYNLTDDDSEAKWEALKYPAKILKQIEEAYGKLVEMEKAIFYKVQIEDEKLIIEKIDSLIGSFTNIIKQSDISKVQETSVEVKKLWKVMKETQEFGMLLNSRQKLFGSRMKPYDRLTQLIKEFDSYKSFWLTAADWFNMYEIWMENPLVNVDGSQIEPLVTEMLKIMIRHSKSFQDQQEILELVSDIRGRIEHFKPYVGVIQALRNPGMKARHLQELSDKIGIKISMSSDVTFKSLLSFGIMEHEETIREISESAAKEHVIEDALRKMIAEWDALKMDVIAYKDTGTYIMKVADEVLLLLDDHIMNTQQITFDPFKAAFEEEIDDWSSKLKLCQDVIYLWMEVQKFWMYLEPIFSSEDISKQLPIEAKKYKTMERNWRRIMKEAFDNPIMIKICPDKTLLESLRECMNLLEVVQKGLSDYLESRRMLFPRFFFLSDDELLEILAQTKNVQAVQPHLKKCFESMKGLRFEDDLAITRMYSAEGEEVTLESPVRPEGSVEYWLGYVEDAMRSTVRHEISKSLKTVESMPRKDWVFMWPGQVSLSVGQTSWTAHVEQAIISGELGGYMQVMVQQLDDLRILVRGQRTEIERLMLEAIITIQVHARDVLSTLIDGHVANTNDFDWISQLRYYWINDSDLKVRAVNAEFQYGYEYLGNNGRLVITPLTDRCYLTLTGALHLKFGGAPAGPAGTGKTETTKDLAKAFAIQCVVFNCSDQLDFMSMGKFFKGLASSGAWACFDEFNRIDVEVLSVIAQQIMTIQKAQQISADRFFFEGVELSLKGSCAVFITMNPGYAGRTELPDNLKALFRPVAMMVPNYTLIAEISLFSCGFGQAKALAAKITATFKLSSEQLSTQDHYDFGMRSVKTVIAVAGLLKREQKDMLEEQICLRALRDVNVPKFLKDDLTLFTGIVSDLFPGVPEKSIDYDMLIRAIKDTLKDIGLADVPEFIQKIIQLYETTIVRHGLMLVGPTGSGKTTCYRVLKATCCRLKSKWQPSGKPFVAVHTYVLNPKSITMGQLYGEFDANTHEWTDGILSTLIRSGTAATDDDKRWYVFDGPVDAVWIENMNTVLDDNKKLCLSSGEIMRLTPTQTMIFEVEDLRVASPATVSRCGMVYFEAQGLGINPFIDCWIEKLPKNMSAQAARVSELAYFFLPAGLAFLRSNLKEIVSSVDSGLVQSYINLMNCQIGALKLQEGKAFPVRIIEAWSLFALVWSVGATCDCDSRYLFDQWLRQLQSQVALDLHFPADGLVYDYKLHYEDTSEEQCDIYWIKWFDIQTIDLTISPEKKFSDIEVPTIDMVRNSALIDQLLGRECNVLCVGPTGSGKTLTVAAKLSRDMPKKFICDFVVFSARTSANQTQDVIDNKLDKRRKGVFGPPLTKKQIFFIDDLNMPALETYGAQPPIELLRQLIDFGGWYDRKEIGSFRKIEDVNIVGAMAPPGGGRNSVTARLLRHFHYIAFPEIEDETKNTIFGTILAAWLSRTQLSLEDVLEPLVTASLRVFKTVCQELLPTPNKSHYTFNVRDLGKVFQGLLMASPAHVNKLQDLLVLWYHENFRVFSDRLINDVDRKWFENLLCENLKREFDYDVTLRESLFYGDFCNVDNRYERILDIEKMRVTLLEYLDDYNNSTTEPMNLVLFEDAMCHICRITRVLHQSPGNALLLGMGGSGRQSLTKLSAHIAEYFCFQIKLSKTYSTRDWRDDIKDLLLKTGLQQRSSVFLFSDTQIKSELFLEDINNILNSGDVPNIYQTDELDRIFQAMRGPVQESGLQINRSNLLVAYQKVVRNNLHLVITMCPIGEVFRARIRQFPALVNLCTIDWFDPWPTSALQSVAMQFLKGVRDDAITDTVLASIVKTCQFMHSSVIKASDNYRQELNRHNYVTPTSYLELISSYGELLAKKRNELNYGISRLSTGLKRLASTEVEVKELQILLEKMKPELEKAAIDAAIMMEQIARDTVEAGVARAAAAEQEREATKLKRENQAIRDEAEADLMEARPMLAAAEASLKALNKNDITEVKAMKRPPVGVTLVIEAICIIKKVKPLRIAAEKPGQKTNDYWTPGSQMLADAGHFLAMLENYNKDEITEDMIEKLKVYIENPGFQPKKVLQVSKACHSLCLWVHAMYRYYFVRQRVAPKMEALRKAEEDLVQTEALLADAMAKVKEVQEGLQTLQMQFREMEEKKAELERQKQLCEDRMLRAVRLISGLAGEKIRWIDSVEHFKIGLTNVIGDILISAGAVAYLTPFTDTYRENLRSSWYIVLGEGVPHTKGCSPISVLGDPVEIRNWQIDGLPRDTLSVENAVLLTNSKRWPLLIDPQGQANRWIKNVGKSGGLSTVRMTDRDLLRVIESCVRFGRICLIENVGLELEPSLDTVLMRSLFRQAGQLCIRIGDSTVPYNFDFRLYLTTKLPNPHYAPEVTVKVLLVNFSLTASALTDQMLSLVVMQERPELEEIRSALVVSMAQMKRELKDIEDRILQRLSSSEGSPVDDLDLILTLEASKVKSEQIKLKVEAAEITQADIDSARSLYIPVAERAQILCFCLLDLQQVDTMYQYSLEWFVRIFVNSIISADKNEDVAIRVNNINGYFTFSLYGNVCRSLFERHKLHFAFLLCIRIQMHDELINPVEWRFLLSGAKPPTEEANPATAWLTQRSWMEIQSLQVLTKFYNFLPSFNKSIRQFKEIFDADQPEIATYPEPWESELNDLEKMILLKCLRADKVTNAIQRYISKFLGKRFIEPQTTGLDSIYSESSCTTPLIFVLSSGTDPASELYKFAEKLKMSRKLNSISLGQGQGPRAELMLKHATEAGNWLFFQNCHLAPSWMPSLEILVERLPPDTTHRDFRLWLTSMPSATFPVNILQNGSKMTIEPPRGVKANVLRAYSTQVSEMQDFFASEHPKLAIFKPLVYSLCLFHSVLLERRKFGPLGFNIPYEFTDGDLKICMSQLRMFLLEYAETPYKVLIYTAGHINYGGRITDDWDRRCVLTILEYFYNERVLQPGHKFDPHGNYVQPATDTELPEYVDVVKRFPINDEPGLFGLHANADISYAQAETYACLATLLVLQPREIGSAVSGMDEVVAALAQSILESLPKQFSLRNIQERYPVSYEESLNTVLYQEAERYNGLVGEMASSLQALDRALKGLVVMSEKLEAMAASLYINRVPQNWQSRGFASLKPLGAWVVDLNERIKFIKSWQDGGIPTAFWISGFYFPQAFLTGTLQNFARKHRVSIDSIDFAFEVLKDKPISRPSNGCAVYGLFLEGCRWDGESLAESLPKELFTEMRPILMIPEVNHQKATTGIYECPVYKTVLRAGTLSTTGHSTNFVLSMEIPSREPPAHWTTRGVALICSLDF
ncbi:dynein axonemal heavy chain 1-like [Phymastichus coffea]|uniref:dynein axonemal heavy chain 1-like n=1 Tax=Phymastichus coffea TaxID=108790 RepID=UPI00273B52DA|nr:dynein axonemal heavy chain 1-like [Phymastichus coffea]